VNNAVLSCRVCEETHPLAPVSHCASCSGPLDVRYIPNGGGRLVADALESDRALLPHRETAIPSRTPLVPAPRVSAALGIDVHLKLETANPTRSFKDRMAASAVKAAQEFRFETVLCASTGNLGAAVAARASEAGLETLILAPAGGAELVLPPGTGRTTVFRVRGTLEDCRRLEHELEALFPWGFLDGNLLPFAVEGIKTIAYEIAEQLEWDTPDAIVSPVASGALFAKVAQGFVELPRLGLIADRRPRMYGASRAAARRRSSVGRRAPTLRGDAEHAGALARRRRSELRRARDRRGPHVGGSITTVAEELIEPEHGAARRGLRASCRPGRAASPSAPSSSWCAQARLPRGAAWCWSSPAQGQSGRRTAARTGRRRSTPTPTTSWSALGVGRS
jgi:threonine synthase